MKRLFALLLSLLTLMLLSPLPVSADTGPKPSVTVTVEHLPEGACYGTLLAVEESTGPYSAIGVYGDANHYQPGDADYDIFQAFAAYEDGDGFHFLQFLQRVDESGSFSWTYYPPQRFKLLLYFPDTGLYAVSAVAERYAFDSCFIADTGGALSGETLTLRASYDFPGEVLTFLCRVALTLLVELGLALLFGFRGKRPFCFLLWVNVGTQLGLNLALQLIAFRSGPRAFFFSYVLLELLILTAEGALYAAFLPRRIDGGVSRRRCWVYALAANAASFVFGLWLANYLPELF